MSMSKLKRKLWSFLYKINFRRKMFKLFKFEENYCDFEDKFSLHVRFTSRCPNRCEWCLDKYCAHNAEDEASGKKMAEVANWSERKLMQVSGGEPMLNIDRLHEFFMNVNKGVKLNLNTYLPKTAYDNREKAYEIFDRCNMIEISCQGISNEEDEATYKTKLNYDKYAFIEELATRYADKIHINTILDKNKTKTMDDLRRLIDWYYSIGIRNFYFKEIGDSKGKQFKDYISFNEILKNSGMKKLLPAFSYGCRPDLSRLFAKEYPGIYVRVKRWCFFEGGEKLTWIDKFKLWLNFNFLRKDSSIVLNENGLFSFWFVNED